MSENTRKPQFNAPLYIAWEVTLQGNARCLHCYSESGPGIRAPNELNTEQALMVACGLVILLRSNQVMSSSEIEQNIPTDFEKYKFARQKLAEEMMYRRERQWKVFSWVSTLLVGITGGVIALNGKDFSFTALHKIALTFAVILLSTFSSIRIYHDSTVALAYSKVIYKLDAEQKLKFTDRA